jgi:hypothetical protein
MEPLFNKELTLVGWIHLGSHIYDTQMNYVAYIDNNHIWSSTTDEWLGPIQGLTCFDSLGKPIAWNPKEFPTGIPKPREPKATVKRKAPKNVQEPSPPKKPEKPLRPMGGWSRMTWEEWLGQ